MQTVEPLAAALGVPPLVRPDCVERCAFFTCDAEGVQIAMPGPTSDEVRARFPTFDVSLLSDSTEPTLETAAGARARAGRVAEKLLVTARGWHHRP